MQACKLIRGANFLFQLCLSFSFIPVCYTARKLPLQSKQKLNRNKSKENCLNCMLKECATYTHGLLESDANQGNVLQFCVSGICCKQKREKLSSTKPSWTPLSCWAPVSCKRQQASAPHNNTPHSQHIPPLPPDAKIFSSRDSNSSYRDSTDPLPWIIPILRSD